MNWQQLRSTFYFYKRIETLIHLLHVAERRQRRRLLVRGIIRRERRSHHRRVHFNDDRDRRHRTLLLFMRVIFLFILLTISIATGLIAFHIHHRYAALLLFVYQLLILTFILFKPRKRHSSRSR